MNMNKMRASVDGGDGGDAIVGMGSCRRGDAKQARGEREGAILDWLVPRRGVITTLGLLLTLSACGGGGGGGGGAAPVTMITMTSPRASQGAGEAMLSYRASLDGAATFPYAINYQASSTAIAGLACTPGVDYYIPVVAGLTATLSAGNTISGTLTMATGASSRQINVMVCPGNTVDRSIFISWNGGGTNGQSTGTVLGQAHPDVLTGSDRLNDTGIVTCADAATNGLACPQASFPNQDADQGRDASLLVTGSGGNRLTAFIQTAYGGGSVIQDGVSGLQWEGKTTDGGLRDSNATFTWFNSNGATNGGAVGTAAGGVCAAVPGGCDTEKYVAAVNGAALGGFTDWRLPTVQELSSLVDAGAGAAPRSQATLANQVAAEYWTASPRAGDTTGAWVVDFNTGVIAVIAKTSARRVRLVRGR